MRLVSARVLLLSQINLRRFAWPGIMQTQLMDLINSHEYDQDADWPLFFFDVKRVRRPIFEEAKI